MEQCNVIYSQGLHSLKLDNLMWTHIYVCLAPFWVLRTGAQRRDTESKSAQTHISTVYILDRFSYIEFEAVCKMYKEKHITYE